MISDHQKVIVVGGGLAGLAAAYRLKQAGKQVKVIEANDYPGGRAASVHKNGYLVDTGATAVGAGYKEYLDLIRELGLGDRIVQASPITGTLRRGKVYEINGKWPLLGGALSSLFSWRSKLIFPLMFLDLKRMGNKMNFQDVSIGHEWDDESAETYALRRLNQEILDYFVDPILRALVVVRAKYVSKLEFMNAISGLFSKRIVGIEGGIGLLPNELAKHLEVEYSSQATRVIDHGDSVEVLYTDAQGQQRTETADGCVLSTLLPQAVSLFPDCESWVKAMNDQLHYVPGICVHLGYKKQTDSKAVMIMIPSKEIPDITLLWLDHNKCSDRAPEGHSLIYFYYDDEVADEAAARSDRELIDQCQEVIESLCPELCDQRDLSFVSRWVAAVPAPFTGMYKRMREVRLNLDSENQTRVQLAGDYLSCVGQNTAINYGNVAARKLECILES